MPERIARIRREEKRDLDRTDMESMNPNGMFSCRGTIDVSNDSTRASSHSSDNLSLFQRIRILCELKSKGKEKREKRLEEKLSDWLKRRFEGKSLVRKGGRRIEESARIGGDRLVGRGAESGRWRGWVDGRYVGVDAGAGTKLTGGRHAVWPCFVSDAAAAARRDAFSRSTTGRPNRSAAAAASDCCDAACHAVPGRLQQDRHRKPYIS